MREEMKDTKNSNVIPRSEVTLDMHLKLLAIQKKLLVYLQE